MRSDLIVLAPELRSAAAALSPAGLFAATFRDWTTKTSQGNDRFIPVRSDDDRISSWFLECGPYRVTLHNLFEETERGGWRQRVDSYCKLRLDPRRVVARLTQRGIEVHLDIGMHGMTRNKAVRA